MNEQTDEQKDKYYVLLSINSRDTIKGTDYSRVSVVFGHDKKRCLSVSTKQRMQSQRLQHSLFTLLKYKTIIKAL